MSPSAFVAGALVLAGFASWAVYRRADRRAADSGRTTHGSVRWFGPLVPLLRLAVVVPALVAVFHDTPWLAYTHTPEGWSAGVGLGLLAAGAFLFLWAMRSLGENYSPCFDKRLPAGIVTSGPYRVMRHPVYTSNLLLVLGAWLAVGSGWILGSWIVTLVGYVLSLREEESALLERYPAYAGYRARTGRLLPRFTIVRG
ncbi:MAG: isoprenylcysteine carboxylmethyltransferase family protein [Planctomycetota bacterium]